MDDELNMDSLDIMDVVSTCEVFANDCCDKPCECKREAEEMKESLTRCLTEEERAEILCQVKVIDQSLNFILLIIVAVALNFFSTKVTRKQLICSFDSEVCGCDCIPNTCNIRMTSSIIIIIALVFFLNLANETHEKTRSSSTCRNKISSELVLLAALIRFIDLTQECCGCCKD